MSNARKFHAQRKESIFQIDCFPAYDIDCLSVLQGNYANGKESIFQTDCFPAYDIDSLLVTQMIFLRNGSIPFASYIV